MILRETIQKLFIFLSIGLHSLLGQECTTLNLNNYGDCGISLGYVWSGTTCSLVYGCDTGEDSDFFFSSYYSFVVLELLLYFYDTTLSFVSFFEYFDS